MSPLEITVETVDAAPDFEDSKMLSPSHNCVEESIAFSVMYYPRTRVQRSDKFNCDTRVLREPGNDDRRDDFIEEGPEPEFEMGFVQAGGEVSPVGSNP